MAISAKFPGTCTLCGQSIKVGDQINWKKGEGSSHVSCPKITPAVALDPSVPLLSLTGRTTDEVGRVIPNPLTKQKEPKSFWSDKARADWEAWHMTPWLVIAEVKLGKEWDDDEERWRKTASLLCRAATAEEAAPFAQDAAKQERADRAHEILRGISLSPWQDTRWAQPEKVEALPSGIKIGGERHDSTTWILAEDGSVWLSVYNGRDGDDWRGNNWGGHSRVWVAHDPEIREWLLAAKEVL